MNASYLEKDQAQYTNVPAGAVRNGRRERAEHLQPFRQGHLDKFCGLYAAINAFNWAANQILIDHNEASELFESIIPLALEMGKRNHTTFSGLKSKDLENLIFALVHSQRVLDRSFRLVSLREFRLVRSVAAEGHKSLIRAACRHEGCALIVRVVDGSFGHHWSVVESIDGNQVQLFDSAKVDSVPLKRCRPWRLVTAQ